jgi:REP element-mobilizing transposase RayT
MEKLNPHNQNRVSVRLKGFDYTKPGAYFITVSTFQRKCLFGEIQNGLMQSNEYGEIVYSIWEQIPEHFMIVKLDAFVVMPNHVHGIIVINGESRNHMLEKPEAFGKPVKGSIPTIVRSFKAAVTKKINWLRARHAVPLHSVFGDIKPQPIWQENYYEHIIRTDEELFQIAEYINNNPNQWENDQENPECQ